MRNLAISILMLLLLFSGCQNKKEADAVNLDELGILKKEFLEQLRLSHIEEGPFSFRYNLSTVFISEDVTSLYGELNVHDRLPHGWKQYEGITCYKVNGRFQRVELEDLFSSQDQKEFLRNLCENSLKTNPISYFSGHKSLCERLAKDDINTFVIDEQNLIIIFQPCRVGGGADGPFLVKIPFVELEGHWNSSHPFLTLLMTAIESEQFFSSWENEACHA